MKKEIIVVVILFLSINNGFAQSISKIDSLLQEITTIKDSKKIINTKQAIQIIDLGDPALVVLSELFTDTTPTQIHSECRDRTLTKGEIAIILADKILPMPYAILIGVQNCLATYCDNNPNRVEYYLDAFQGKEMITFQKTYQEWLTSDHKKEWTSLFY